VTALAVKSVDERIAVGGPSSAAAGWVDDLLAHCRQSGSPVDFVSTHTYGSPPLDVRASAVRHGFPDARILWTEWGVTPRHFNPINDSVFSGIFLLRGMRSAAGRIDESLARVGLTQRADDRVKAYSLGMRQRLGIARCLLADPALLILDEPMNGLDPAGILETRHLIRAFVDEGRTVFLSSHLLDEVEKTCDQIAIVDQGRVILQGAVDEIAATGDPTVLLDVDDAEAARTLLSAESRVTKVEQEGHELRVTLADGLGSAELNKALVQAGIAVSRLEPARATLEEKFLEVTSRLESNE
jgi:ABC-type uncharacterized transport system ATPase subunit